MYAIRLENNELSITEILDSLKERTTSTTTDADGVETIVHNAGNTKFLSKHHFIEINEINRS